MTTVFGEGGSFGLLCVCLLTFHQLVCVFLSLLFYMVGVEFNCLSIYYSVGVN